MHPTRVKVLEAFRANPLATTRELAQASGVSNGAVCNHLQALRQDGLIVRPVRVRDTSKCATPATPERRKWNQIHGTVLPNGRGNHSNSEKRAEDGRKGRGTDAFTAKPKADEATIQSNIERVIARAVQEGTCFRLEYLDLKHLRASRLG